nr:DUF4189 domain-containing protein [Stenotrophomonas geniculata]
MLIFSGRTVLFANLCLGAFLFCAWTPIAKAEGNCPSGFYPVGGQGVQGCAPIPGAGAGGQQQVGTQVSHPTGRWHKTWGAIATGGQGDTGVSKQKFSKREAEQEALSQCATWGATNCQVKLTYHNQCVAIASPQASQTGAFFASAAEVGDAKEDAMAGCGKKGGVQCKVMYSACSAPVFEQF